MVPYGPLLGEALLGNDHVSSIMLNLSYLLAEDEEGTESVALLLRYIRESEVMRKIEVRNGHHSVVRHFVLAIEENPCIETLLLKTYVVPPEAVARLLQTTQSLKTLDMSFCTGHWTAAERKLVAEAFGANRTLESLRLDLYCNTITVVSVLLQMGPHPRLRELSLDCQEGASVAQIIALAHLLGCTASIEHLVISQLTIDKERMECLVEGLHSNQSLTKLSFILCEFNMEEATDTFRSFMQTRDSKTSIRELCIFGNDGTFAFSSAGTMVASMLTMPEENQDGGSSVGSSLQVLDLKVHAICVVGFIDALAANASRIRLSCLRLSHCWNYQLKALCSCIPKLVYLEELDISEVYMQDVGPDFVDALRQNGSLRRVTIAAVRDELRDFSVRERLLLKHYCKRNEAIPITAATIRLDNDDKTDVSLLPMLFQLAKQARRTAPNAMLIGLLAAGDSIGIRHCDRKRVRPDE